jgi:hypothetical protein
LLALLPNQKQAPPIVSPNTPKTGKPIVLLKILKPVLIVPAVPHIKLASDKHLEVSVGAVKVSKAEAVVIAIP